MLYDLAAGALAASYTLNGGTFVAEKAGIDREVRQDAMGAGDPSLPSRDVLQLRV